MPPIREGHPDDGAPVDFQISSSDSDGDDTYTFDTLRTAFKCPLCSKLKDQFTCVDCLRSSNFRHSSPAMGRLQEQYVDLKKKLNERQSQRNVLIVKCKKYTQNKEEIAKIVSEIEACANRISLQKDLKVALELTIAETDRISESTKKSTLEKTKNWPLYRSRLDNMLLQHRHKISKLNKYNAHIQGRKEYLQSVTKTRILQLKEYVFPIEQTNRDFMLSVSSTPPTPRQVVQNDGLYADLWDDVDEEDDTVSALMAATSQYCGKLEGVLPNANENLLHYAIPAPYGPTLPASGEYSVYTEWANKGLDKSSGQGQSTTRNPAHCIDSGLTYATQFVNLIAYYLDLRLPHRLSYSEFTNGDLTGRKFYRKVAKLNGNIIHLCASQAVPHNYIQPRRTIPNLLLLFDSSVADLGRRGPFEVASQLARSMEQSIEKDLVIYEEDSSESEADWCDSNFPSDWENVQRGTITEEMSAENMTAHNNQSYFQSSYQQQHSDLFLRSRSNANTGGSIMASVTSFFKGWGA